MSTITPGVVQPVAGGFNTTPAMSGTFIPILWSSKLNAKFYTASVFGEIANTNWEGEIKALGDKIIIQNIPDIAISNYQTGAGISYQVPVPSTITLQIDKAKSFAFQIADVLNLQAKPNLMDMFSNDASMQMKVSIDSTVLYNTFSGADPANKGITAGAKSGSYSLGSDAAPIVLTASNVLQTLMSLAGVLDEYNVPETDRYLLIDPYTRQQLMTSNLAQAQFMGDATSIVRNGRIGAIDRFVVYVTNNLPKAGVGINTPYLSGDGTEATIASTSGAKRRIIIAGHKSAISFASQMTKVEQVRNPYDFGDYVRGLNVYGYTVAKPQGLAYAVVA